MKKYDKEIAQAQLNNEKAVLKALESKLALTETAMEELEEENEALRRELDELKNAR